MKVLVVLTILLTVLFSGCSPSDKKPQPNPVKQNSPEDTARNILKSRSIATDGVLTKEEEEKAKKHIDTK